MAIKSITKTRPRLHKAANLLDRPDRDRARERQGDTGRQTAWQTALVWVDRMLGYGAGVWEGVVGSFFGSSMTTCRQRIESMLCRDSCAVRKSCHIVELYIYIAIYTVYIFRQYIQLQPLHIRTVHGHVC